MLLTINPTASSRPILIATQSCVLYLHTPTMRLPLLQQKTNSRPNQESKTNSRIVGLACYYENTNDNRQRMIEFCEATYLRKAHSHFLNLKARLYTFTGPKEDHQQLDHIMIRCKWWKSKTNCRAYNTIQAVWWAWHRLEDNKPNCWWHKQSRSAQSLNPEWIYPKKQITVAKRVARLL